MPIRRFQTSDLPALHAANQASVPGVSTETESTLAKWIGLSSCWVATGEDGTPLGFITLIEPGTLDYDSANLRWFETYCAQTRKSLIYVDRIAFAPKARGQGLGEQLYRRVFEHFSDRDEIGCEVNILPPNPGSHRFHQKLGFRQVGEQEFEEGSKSVAYYVRALR